MKIWVIPEEVVMLGVRASAVGSRPGIVVVVDVVAAVDVVVLTVVVVVVAVVVVVLLGMVFATSFENWLSFPLVS